MKYPILVLASLTLLAAAPAPQATALPPPPMLSPAPSTSPSAIPSVVPSIAPTATPPSVLPTPTPSLDDQMGGRHRGGRGERGGGPEATPTPPVDTRKGLDGVWELQIQRGANTEYEHMDLMEKGEDLTGYYLVAKTKQKLPITGVLDDQHNVRLVVTRPDGTTILLEARVDGTTDMLGMFTDSQERVPFTAAYRPKEKFVDNINATPGGLPGAGSGPGGP